MSGQHDACVVTVNVTGLTVQMLRSTTDNKAARAVGSLAVKRLMGTSWGDGNREREETTKGEHVATAARGPGEASPCQTGWRGCRRRAAGVGGGGRWMHDSSAFSKQMTLGGFSFCFFCMERCARAGKDGRMGDNSNL